LQDFLHRIFISIKEDKQEFLEAQRYFRSKREEVFSAACQVISEGIEKVSLFRLRQQLSSNISGQ